MFEWVWDRQRKKMSWEHKALQGLGERRSRSRDYYPMKKGFIWCTTICVGGKM